MARREERFELQPDIRLSDADRDQAVARLSEHYAVGRLDKDEFDERSDAVWSARTGADLAPLFVDLEPRRPLRRQSHPAAAWRRGGWFPVPFFPVLFVLIALTAVTHVPFVLLALLGWVVLGGRRRRRSHW